MPTTESFNHDLMVRALFLDEKLHSENILSFYLCGWLLESSDVVSYFVNPYAI